MAMELIARLNTKINLKEACADSIKVKGNKELMLLSHQIRNSRPFIFIVCIILIK